LTRLQDVRKGQSHFGLPALAVRMPWRIVLAHRIGRIAFCAGVEIGSA